MRLLFSLLFTISLLFSQTIKPNKTYIASGSVTDLVITNSKLYVGTDASAIDIFDMKTSKHDKSITIPQIKDFMGDIINAKIYSLDVIDDKVMIVSQGQKGFRRISIYENGKLVPILTETNKMYIAKAKFVDKNHIVLSLLSNQMFLYNINEHKFIWEIQISQSKFSNFVLTEDKKEVIVADESGALKQIRLKDGKATKTYSGINVDNVFQVDIKNDVVITAGQDRRCAIYNNKNLTQYYKKADFLIYSAGLSPSGEIAGFANNEDNEITIFNTKNKKELYTLKGHKMTLTNILFINENELFSSSDDNEVYFWNLTKGN